MKKIKVILTLIFVLFLSLLNSCKDDDEVNEIYLEGEPIPGIEIPFPLGYYSGDPLMPKISPDGKKLLFTGPSGLPDWKGLWIMDLDTQQKTLLHPNGRNGDWAPDSEWIAFNVGSEIFKIKIDGTDLIQLTYPIEVEVGGLTKKSSSFFPDWSPDNKIAYYLSIDYRTNEDGTKIITDSGGKIEGLFKGGQPDWHPNGQKIIGIIGIASNSSETQFPIYNFNSNEIERILIADPNQFNQFPKFSGDGNKLSFSNDQGIYLMDSNGSNIKRIVPSHLYGENRKDKPKLYAAYPSWHPNGNEIVYEHFRITKYSNTSYGILVEGVINFYKVNAEDAVTVSNLK